ncbi:MAG TPA: AraC family transcriptional regulator [Rhizomicrobium sp.]|jgi:AraC-like DNA-binding protein
MDPLSDVLSLLKPRGYVAGGIETAGLAVQFPRHDGIKCYAMVSGECWLSVESVAEPVHLKEGDCFLLPRGFPFRLAADLSLTPIDFREFLARRRDGEVTTFNGDGGYIVGGHFALSGDPAGMLLGVLPPIVHIRNEADKATLRWAVERMMQELRNPQPGGFLVVQHLAHMLLVQALRLHLAEGTRVGWLFALADKQMGAAITAMHDDPAHRWTLQELAERAGMSRSTFALKFKETVGASPLEYLARWRMLLAGDRLANSPASISTIAQSLGYESESAFSTAFKRVMGSSPRQYSRGRIPAPMQGAAAE